MLRLDGITFSYGTKEALRDISLHMAPGELVSILGPNGSGKSSLLRTIDGLLTPRRGAVYVDGNALSSMSGREIAMKMGYMPQKANGISCTVFDAVLLGRKPHMGWKESPHDIGVVEGALKMLGMEEEAFRSTAELSGGEFQKVVIARALAQEPGILLLDEPINHLDIRNQMEILELLRKITRELGLVTIIVLHDLNTALRFADRFVMMKKGTIFAFGDRKVVTRESILEVYGIDSDIHFFKGIPVVIPMRDDGKPAESD